MSALVTSARRAVPRWAAPWAVATAAAAGCVLLWAADPVEAEGYPPCPFLVLTGRWCPGCGSLRALGRLVRLDVAGAAAQNVLLVVALPYLAWRYLAWALPRLGGRRLPRGDLPTAGIWSLLVVILVFWGLRNLPAFAFLAPR